MGKWIMGLMGAILSGIEFDYKGSHKQTLDTI